MNFWTTGFYDISATDIVLEESNTVEFSDLRSMLLEYGKLSQRSYVSPSELESLYQQIVEHERILEQGYRERLNNGRLLDGPDSRALRYLNRPIFLSILWQAAATCWGMHDFYGSHPIQSIQSIQASCKFYNAAIFNNPPIPRPQNQEPSKHPTINVQGDYLANGDKFQGDKILGDKYEINQVGNLNTGNLNTGNQIGIQQQASDSEMQATLAEMQTLLTDLQTKYPNVTNTSQALEIIDAEFTEIKRTPTHKLATLRRQILNPERHFQALKATAEEVAKHYLEESIWSKAGITYINKLSETPNHGE